MTIIPDYALPVPSPELAAQGEVGRRESKMFRRLAVSRLNADRFSEIGNEAFRRHLTVQTHVGGFAHMVMSHVVNRG